MNTPRIRIILIGVAVVLVATVSAIAAWVISANQLPPETAPTPMVTVTDTPAPFDMNRLPVEPVEPEAGGDPGHDHGTGEPNRISNRNDASNEEWLKTALREWVTFDSAETTEARAARLEPYFTAEQIATAPVLGRVELAATYPNYTAFVDVHDVTYPALIAPHEDGTNALMTEACYKTVVDYVANWNKGTSSDATRFGDNYWTICVPVEFSTGAMTITGLATVKEPSIEFGD